MLPGLLCRVVPAASLAGHVPISDRGCPLGAPHRCVPCQPEPPAKSFTNSQNSVSEHSVIANSSGLDGTEMPSASSPNGTNLFRHVTPFRTCLGGQITRLPCSLGMAVNPAALNAPDETGTVALRTFRHHLKTDLAPSWEAHACRCWDGSKARPLTTTQSTGPSNCVVESNAVLGTARRTSDENPGHLRHSVRSRISPVFSHLKTWVRRLSEADSAQPVPGIDHSSQEWFSPQDIIPPMISAVCSTPSDNFEVSLRTRQFPCVRASRRSA